MKKMVMMHTQIPMQEITHILLDMDGTLLDLYFDDYFWGQHVPQKYAEKHSISFDSAKEMLYAKYKSHEKTLNWCDIDFWSRELYLDIPALKEQVNHLIDVHPHVIEFLNLMREQGKKIFLLTNAHFKAVNIKFRKTQIGKYFDEVLSSFHVGHPKEDLDFWHKAQKKLQFDKERSLFIDDTEDVLKTAREYGIKHLLFKAKASSMSEPKKTEHFPTIHDFRELM
ncbi:MAG: GMP/IMP nucleotidase [Chlorobiales bacterium]|nr:GMP/IMP nucleotidase [Chlorobiales bacterium]